MLRLRGEAVRLIRLPYICSSCSLANRTSTAIERKARAPVRHVSNCERLFTSTSWRRVPEVEISSQSTSDTPPTSSPPHSIHTTEPYEGLAPEQVAARKKSLKRILYKKRRRARAALAQSQLDESSGNQNQTQTSFEPENEPSQDSSEDSQLRPGKEPQANIIVQPSLPGKNASKSKLERSRVTKQGAEIQPEIIRAALKAVQDIFKQYNIDLEGLSKHKSATLSHPSEVKPAAAAKNIFEGHETKSADGAVRSEQTKKLLNRLVQSNLPSTKPKDTSTAASRSSRISAEAALVQTDLPLTKDSTPVSEVEDLSTEPKSKQSRRLKTSAGHGVSKSAMPSKRDKAKRLSRKDTVEEHGLASERRDMTKRVTVSTMSPKELRLEPITRSRPSVPAVAHGLDRVLFNPGVYHLQDPRSRVYNFDPYLANIMPIEEFDFDALKQYVTSSKDETLLSVAREHGQKYTGSTSSMTSALAHFHYLLSAWRPVSSQMMSQEFRVQSSQFTTILRAPAATFLHWKDGVYAIDADKEFDSATVLSMLGKSMEKLLTLPKEEYEKYRHGNSDQITEEQRNAEEAFHYTKLGDFMMRSQLDAHDPRIPGTGMFDIKTRAVVTIRMDAKAYEKGTGYEIRQRQGNWESFEREYHDMIRAAFLKYSLQVRMGRMDGIFVAFHNTRRIFGFQYIPLEEMDLAIHGTDNIHLGHREFKLSVALLNELLDRATAKYPKRSLRLHFETRPSSTQTFMYFFAKPVEPNEIEAVQEAGKASAEEVERQLRGVGQVNGEVEPTTETQDEPEGKQADEYDLDEVEDQDASASWEEVQLMVEDAVACEELGIEAVREAIEHSLNESGLLGTLVPDESRRYVDALLDAITAEDSTASAEAAEASSDAEVNDEQTSVITDEAGTRDLRNASEQQDIEESKRDEIDPKDEPPTSLTMPALKNLILSLTRRFDKSPPREDQQDSVDSSKLQAFEHTLRELITKSRKDPAKQPVESSPSIHQTSESSSEATSRGAGSSEEADTQESSSSISDSVTEEATSQSTELLGLVLTVRNKVNEKYVQRPSNLTKDDDWTIEYNIAELPDDRAQILYKMCKKRRKRTFHDASMNRDSAWQGMFQGDLAKYSQKGRKWRSSENNRAQSYPVFVVGDSRSKAYEDVFGSTKPKGGETN